MNTNVKVIRSGHEYLSSQTGKVPKLLVGCGHLTQQQSFYPKGDDDGCDFRGQLMHQHREWYTVDRDPKRCPDLLGHVENSHTLSYLVDQFSEKMRVVYVEGWSFQSENFYQMACNILQSNGAFIYPLDTNNSPQHLGQIYQLASRTGFDPQFSWMIHNPINHHDLRRAMKKFPFAHSIEEIDNRSLYEQLIIVAQEQEDLQKVMDYKLKYVSGSLKQFFNNLKRLSNIDTDLGWSLSFEYNRDDYIILTKK